MFRKLRSTQKARHPGASGHVPNSPTAHDPHVKGAETGRLKAEPSADNYPVHWGPRAGRVGEDNKRLSNITNERARSNPNPLARRFTKFIQNMRGQVRIPGNVVGNKGSAVGRIDVGQVPED